jgi:Protein of unknown function (DUF4239)
MNLLLLLNEMSPWVVALTLVAVAEIYSIGLMLLFRSQMGADRLALNNEVAGFKFAVVGVFYAVLLAFVVVAVWENYRDTEAAVRNEAKALSDIHQASYALAEDVGDKMRKHLISYTEQVRDVEWPSMAKAQSSGSAANELHNLGETILLAKEDNIALYHHVIDLLTTINDNRNERLDSSDGSVPNVLWLVLIAGALITLGYPSFFGSSNITAQILMTAALAALVALTAFVAVVLDYPFTGGVQISREPFEQFLAQMPTPMPPP